jgi:hypothetical protein
MQKGFYVIRGSGAAQLSPPFPRGGQGIVLTADILDVPGGGVTLQIDVLHKNLADTSWTPLGSFAGITAIGLAPFDATGLMEQLAISYRVTGGASPQVYDMFYLDMLAPVWIQ